MTATQWKEQIYIPYVDAWKVIKILQEAYNHPELFEKYMDEVAPEDNSGCDVCPMWPMCSAMDLNNNGWIRWLREAKK